MTRNAATGGIGSSVGRLTKMTLESANGMQEINTALAASKEAIAAADSERRALWSRMGSAARAGKVWVAHTRAVTASRWLRPTASDF